MNQGRLPVDKAELNDFRQLLENQLDQLLRSASSSVVNLMDMDGRAADPVDRASVESDREYTFRIRTRESLLIRKIKDALDAIENGEFGICQRCGEEISTARLKARPVTQYCIKCKSEMEKWEKVVGM
jgi:DnaK suppressor protein